MRIGAVSYLNSKPLVSGLHELLAGDQLVFDLPSRLADSLATGELDVALIPSIEFAQNDDYVVLSDACIGCRGPVWSVKLLSRVPIGEISEIALDEGSRTSIALAQILLARRYGLRPRLTVLPIDQRLTTGIHEAALVIGDRAMHVTAEHFPYQWDLGREWTRLTGLPFVFAMWAARAPAACDELGNILAQARDRGVANLRSIAAQEAPRHRITVDQCLKYFRQNLNFHIGQEERLGLQTFFTSAAELDLISPEVDLNFHDCQAAR